MCFHVITCTVRGLQALVEQLRGQMAEVGAFTSGVIRKSKKCH